MRNEPGRCSVGEYLAQRLEQAGVRHYFTVPGRLQPRAARPATEEPPAPDHRLLQRAERRLRRRGVRPGQRDRGTRGHVQRRRAQRTQRRGLRVRRGPARGRHLRRDQQRLGGGRTCHPPRPRRGPVRLPAADLRARDGRGLRRPPPGRCSRGGRPCDRTAIDRRKPVYLEIDCNLAGLAVPAPTPQRFDAGPGATRPPSPPPSLTPRSCWPAREAGARRRPADPAARRPGPRSASSPTPRATPSPPSRPPRGCSRRTTRRSPASTGAR